MFFGNAGKPIFIVKNIAHLHRITWENCSNILFYTKAVTASGYQICFQVIVKVIYKKASEQFCLIYPLKGARSLANGETILGKHDYCYRLFSVPKTVTERAINSKL